MVSGEWVLGQAVGLRRWFGAAGRAVRAVQDIARGGGAIVGAPSRGRLLAQAWIVAGFDVIAQTQGSCGKSLGFLFYVNLL